MKNASEAAFPLISSDGMSVNQGLTKREYFAGLAMQGILAKKFDSKSEDIDDTIMSSIEYADALLKALEK